MIVQPFWSEVGLTPKERIHLSLYSDCEYEIDV